MITRSDCPSAKRANVGRYCIIPPPSSEDDIKLPPPDVCTVPKCMRDTVPPPKRGV